jgi:hypothetical protein
MTAPETEFGLDSFGEVSAEPSGRLPSDAEAVRLMIDEAVLAETAGSTPTTPASTTRPSTSTLQVT